jgi:hypothetical protein
MRTLIIFVLAIAGTTPVLGAGKTRGGKRAPAARSAPAEARAEARAETRPEPRADTAEAVADPKPAPAKAPKAKVYTFNGLDVEGKLKTPQLLYFLNRVKLELDTTGREKRSFLKELEQSSDDKGL